jgi:acyl dehydratase
MEKQYLEDYTLGETFVSPARTLTETDLIQFAGLTGDWHPLHTDAAYAASTPFGGRIVHGLLTFVIGSALVLRLGPHLYLPKSFIAFYGIDKIRFTAPVRIGDTIHSVNRVQELETRDAERGILQYQSEIRKQDGQTAVVWVSRMLVGRRPSVEGGKEKN